MATTTGASTELIPTQQIIVHQDDSVFPIRIILDETNYSLWSQLMEMRIGARNKAGYLTGEMKKPEYGDPNLGAWITENQRVKSWLIDSMSPSLMQRFIRLSTAKEIWEAVSKTFYDGSSANRNNQSSGKANNLVCTHCREKGHSQQRFYDIIGYPEWWDFSKKPRKKIAGKAMMTSSEENQSLPTANVAHPGSIGKASVFSATSKNRTWIIDTGASDHMTRDSSKLKSILPSSQSVISTANGSTSSLTGEGSVILSNTLTLDTVLVVPSLEYNLLSVSQITSTLACTVTF